MWHAGVDALVLVVGHLRWRNGTWSSPTTWAEQLATSEQRSRLPASADELHGVFIIAWADNSGASIVADPLGFRCIYYGENEHVATVASRASLVAAALAGAKRPASKDVDGTAWFSYNTYRVGDTSGFENVRVLPPGAVATVDPTIGLRVTRAAPWMPTETERDLTRSDLAAFVRDDIADTLKATLTFPAERRVMSLSGGKDSRLLLAVALWVGIAHEFEYETFGPPRLADVKIASALAERYGLRHRVRFVGMAPEAPYAERLRNVVARTAGMLNAWELEAPGENPDEVRVLGLCGEMLRTFRPLKSSVTTTKGLLHLFEPEHFNRLGIVKPDVANLMHDRVRMSLLDDPSGDADALALLDAYYIKNRLRFTRLGPQQELPGQLRVLPLYSVHAVRSAFALNGIERQTGCLPYEVMRLCSEELVSLPFADSEWDPRLGAPEARAFVPLSTPQPAADPTVEPAKAPKPRPLMQIVQSKAFEDRRPLFERAFRDGDNPAWRSLDRAGALAALDRFETLAATERRELFGALTAAMWLGNDSDGPD